MTARSVRQSRRNSGRSSTRRSAHEQHDPHTIRPMLPVLHDEPFDSPDHIFEIKWGGVRAIAEIDGRNIRLHGQNLRDLTPLYPELSAVAGSISAHHAVVDGEIVAWGEENVPAFDLLRPRLFRPDEPITRSRRAPLIFQMFDMLELNGRWLLHYPLFERRNLLHERLQPNRYAAAADFVREDGIAFFEAVVTHKLEGIIAKDKLSQYLPGERSKAWQEIRAIQSDNFVIGGYTFGGGRIGGGRIGGPGRQGSRKKDLLASLLIGAYRGERLEFVGEVHVGCSDREQRQLLDLVTPLHSDRSPFAEAPVVERFFYWCRPELACHIRYSQWTGDSKLRFPLFVAPRPDVPPEECVYPAG